ncbi:GntR family transcriptional regulator [Streptomyces sp. NPDC058653]|uniref:GntR family transcriptional regulator n=1 Tax=Streptomyces sp. NPDC058653 TaxID=3346576 RepID=UPI00365AE66A
MPTERVSGPLPQQIADQLRARIEDQVYPLGEKLPSQRALAEEFGVARETIKGALARLESEGFIKTRQGARSEVTRAGAGSAAGEEADEASVVRTRQILTDARQADPDVNSLESVIKRAFLEKEVTLDAYSLTTESLGRHLVGQLDAVERGELRPDSVTLRLLVPSGDFQPAYPAAVDQSDTGPFERWRRSVEVHLSALKQKVMILREKSDVTTEVRLEIKRVEVTPTIKLYILNDVTLLFGVYALAPRNMILDDDSVVLALDVLGLQSNLFYHSATDDETQGSLYLTEFQAMFDGLWKHAHGMLRIYPPA